MFSAMSLALISGVPASAASLTVCASGCQYSTIQAAVNAANPGDQISVGPGTYAENVVIPITISIMGSGPTTVVYPAVNGPKCGDSPGAGTLCTGSSTVFLVQADNVTIANLRIEGANPNLTGGVMVGGASVNARNGIVDDFRNYPTVYDGLTVQDVIMSDIYHRGIYEASGGSGFRFVDNTVSNVQGSAESVAIFNFGGSGLIEGNTVSAANDAISANWSGGTQFLDNTVVDSGSGIHTDNSGWSGTPDVIEGNTIENCTTGGYGIFTYAQDGVVTVSNNVVRGCYVGLAVFGSALAPGSATGVSTAFVGNMVSGRGAKTTDPTGTYGVYIVTDVLYYGYANASATLTGNSISGFGTGFFASQTVADPISQLGPPAGDVVVTANNNNIVRNDVGANGETGVTVDATSNWWGCSSGPGHNGCDSATGVSFEPWLMHSVRLSAY